MQDPSPTSPCSLPSARIAALVDRGASDAELDELCAALGRELAPRDEPHEEVLRYWFGAPGSTWHPRYRGPSELWFRATPQHDQEIRERFLERYEAAAAGALASWAETQRGALALVLLLDQLPRHMFRGQARMFATDAAALAVAERALDPRLAGWLSPAQQAFLYLCLEHAEDLETVARAAAGLDALCRSPVTRRARRLYKSLRRSAWQHQELLGRFGRYPHRNALLGRPSTPPERAWLLQTEKPRFARSVELPDVAPLRLLVLHSFRQSAARLSSRTRALREALASVAELVYVDAPHAYAATDSTRAELAEDFGPDLEDLGDLSHQRCWWNSGDDHTRYAGWEPSRDYLRQVCEQQGPFDGVLGFSQGAAAAALFVAEEARRGVPLRLAICISGFPSRAHEHQALLAEGSIDVPSLHVWGERDVLVDNDRSRALARCFAAPQVVSHAGGHFVPMLWPTAEIRDFLIRHARPATTCSLEERIRYARTHHRPIGLTPAGQALWACLQSGGAQGELRARVAAALAEAPEPTALHEDLHVMLWALQRSHDHGSSEGILAPMPGDEFHRLYLVALELAPEAFEPWVSWIPRVGGWALLVRLAIYATIAPSSGTTTRLRARIVEMFCERLALERQSEAPVSDCSVAAPRTDSAVQRACGLAGDIAVRMFPAPQRTDSYVAYTRLVSALSRRYHEAHALVPTLRAQRRQTALVWQAVPDDAPLSDEVVRPRPVPVQPCPAEELEPLLEHLEHKQPVDEQTRFVRGTHMPDGRLDLCKQVVGPAGIGPVLEAVADHPHVTRLMIGNNIVGNSGALAIADFIRSSRSHIDVWYIAGNEIDVEGLVPVCEALYDDPHVKSLWLKRNPLGPGAGPVLAELLRRNRWLHTLDLVNTGLLDDGAIPVIEALADNEGLRHVYLGTNGLTSKSAEALAAVLRQAHHLESVFLSCNRLGDEGARHLADALRHDRSLVRLGLASNRLGPAAAVALAEALVEHPRLRFLDLGWTRATAAVGELGNQVGNEGARALAELLRTNPVLQALDVSHNRISQAGIDAIAEVLEHNRSLVFLRHPQHGKAVNHDSLERLHARLHRNRTQWSTSPQGQETRVDDILTPRSTQEILSVYRMA